MRPNLRTEQEIMKNWKDTKTVVSICCLAYNHELYIEDALEGFLIQETDFPFEVLIHDDASTDHTADIIREYELAYPHIIKPIYQTINQFTHGGNITIRYQYPRAKGEYIALCEGDDYWTNSQKLIKSINFLKNNPDYVACCHDVIIINGKGELETETPFGKYKGDLYSIDDQIRYNNIPTLSLIYRRYFCPNEIEMLRNLSKNCQYIGDIQRKCFLLKYGKIKYFKEKMGVYRWNRSGGHSFSSQNSLLKYLDTFFALINVYKYLNHKSKVLKQEICHIYFRILFVSLKKKQNISVIYHCLLCIFREKLWFDLLFAFYRLPLYLNLKRINRILRN